MKKDVIYPLTAIIVLVVAVIGLVFARSVIMADIEEPVRQSNGTVMGAQSIRKDSIPLKVGWNYFVNRDFTINQESEIIRLNGEMFSVNEALAFGIIDRVIMENTRQALIENIKEIPAGSGFEIYVSNIDNNPAVFLNESD